MQWRRRDNMGPAINQAKVVESLQQEKLLLKKKWLSRDTFRLGEELCESEDWWTDPPKKEAIYVKEGG